MRERVHNVGRNVLDIFVKAAAEDLDEVTHQKRNIFRAFAKRGDLNGENVEAVIKVAAESALADEFGKILVRGGDDADIHALRAVAAEALEFLFLQNAQQFGLEVERKVADFIKKERAAVGQFEAADLLIDGPSERALFMAE